MASGFSSGRGKSIMSSTIHSKPSSYDREDTAELNQRTRDVVDEFKRSIQDKLNQNMNIDKSTIELEVSTIRRRIFRDQCKVSAWKKDLPEEIENCPDDILIASIAYGDNPNEVKSIVQEKMNQSTTTNGSLNKILGPLKKLKTDLDRSQPMNILGDVRNIDDNEIERANRMFLSEALRFAPGVKSDFTYQDAAIAVEGIRQSNCQSIEDQYLLAIIKTGRSVDDVRDIVDQQPKKSTKPTSSFGQSSRFDDDDRDTVEQQPKKSTKLTNSFGQSSRFDDDDRDTVEQQPKKSTKLTNSFGQSSRFDDEERDTAEQQPTKKNKQANLPAQNSRLADDDRSNTSSPKTSNISNSNYSYKPLESPSFSPASSKPTKTTSRRFNDSSDDDSPSNPPPRKPERR